MLRPSLPVTAILVLFLAGCRNGPTQPPPERAGPEIGASRSLPAGGPPVEVSCGQVITESVALANDLVDCPGNGIVVGADDLVIDGRGHTVDGQETAVSYGVRIDGRTGVIVKNLRITEFTIGVGISGSDSNRILRNDIFGNVLDGVLVDAAAHDNDIAHNEFTGNSIAVRLIATATDNRVAHNRIVEPRFGNAITLLAASRNEVTSNTIRGGGVNLVNASENVVERNDLVGAPVWGYRLHGESNGNVLTNNRVSDVSGSGFFLFGVFLGPSGNTLTGNRSSRNTEHGYRGFGTSSANTLDRNVAVENGGFGFRDETSGTGASGTANTYERNRCRDNEEGPSLPESLCRAPAVAPSETP